MKKYLYHYDCLRTLGCIFIIGIHSTDTIIASVELYSLKWWFGVINQIVFRIGLPLFFLISGALILNSKEESLTIFYKKRVLKICIPFFIVSLFYLAVNKYGVNIFNLEILLMASKEILAQSVESHLWFVYVILGLYIITPFLKVMLKNLSDKMLLNLTFTIIMIHVIYTYLPASGIKIGINNLMFYGWIDYFIMGYCLTRDIATKYFNKIILLGIFSFVVSIIILRCLPQYSANLYDLSPTMLFMTSTLFVLFEKNKEVINEKRKMFIIVNFISKYSFTTYLIHRFVLDKMIHKNGINAFTHGLLIGTVTSIVLTFGISLIMAFILDNCIMKPINKFLSYNFVRKNVVEGSI